VNVVIYHNPKCSKSRQTLQLLQENGADPEIIEYLKTPPSVARLTFILNLLAIQPRALMRQQEAEYKDNRLDDASIMDEVLIQAMVSHPRLIDRPIVIIDDAMATIGRPPEKALALYLSSVVNKGLKS